MDKKRKQAITLLEIMIVIFLIGIISGVLGYNVKGSLDKGKAFKTEKGIDQVCDILELMIADGYSIEEVTKNPARYLNMSGLVKRGEDSIKDGWGHPMKISHQGSRITVSSERLAQYRKAHPKPKSATAVDDATPADSE